MMQNTMKTKSKYHHLDPQSLSFKLFLIYDIFMVFIITFNLFCLGANLFLMSNIGAWFFQSIQLLDVLNFYRTHLHPWVVTTEAWFIIFLIAELIIRWGIAIVQRHHQRWFFFPLFIGMKFWLLSHIYVFYVYFVQVSLPTVYMKWATKLYPPPYKEKDNFITVWSWKSYPTELSLMY